MDAELKAYLDEWRAELQARFARVDDKLGEHDARFDAIHVRFNQFDNRLDVFDRRFDLVAEALVRIEHRLERATIA
jgi:hypothetical protein